MTIKTLKLIFEIIFAIIILAAIISGAVLFQKWHKVLNREPIKIIQTEIDGETETP